MEKEEKTGVIIYKWQDYQKLQKLKFLCWQDSKFK